MAKVTIDTAEVDAYIAELKRIPAEMGRHVAPVVKRAAQNIKTEQQADLRGSSNAGLRKIGGFVNYDEPSSGTVIETEIGIDKGGAGSLGNIAVYGTPKGGGTHPHTAEFAEKEMPSFTRHLSDVAAGLLL